MSLYCIVKNINLCERSLKCMGCIEVVSKNQIKNTCDKQCDITNWTIKAEGRGVFVLSSVILNKDQTASLTLTMNKQDTLFLRDDKGKLVLWKVY